METGLQAGTSLEWTSPGACLPGQCIILWMQMWLWVSTANDVYVARKRFYVLAAKYDFSKPRKPDPLYITMWEVSNCAVF